MSDSLAIAAVTATIKQLLGAGVPSAVNGGAKVTASAPDRARGANTGNQVNLFLYQTSLDPAWRNREIPGRTQPGEDGRPPLPLTLYYLVTAYPHDDDEILAHRLLGRAMGVLHDHPLLGAEEIKGALGESDLDEQVERIRITPQPMTVEEMSKLWTTFQTQYRISAAYQASVVLIESKLPVRAPPPVLSRGDKRDSGAVAQADTTAPIPTVDGLVLPDGNPSALLGDTIVLTGHDLEDIASISIEHRRLPSALGIPLSAGSADSENIELSLPDDPSALPAGLCSLRGLPAEGASGLPTNEVSLAIAPKAESAAATRGQHDEVTVTITCRPEVVPGQDLLLLLSDRSIARAPVAAATTSLEFTSKRDPSDDERIAAGDYLLRLRVDGIDSHLVDRSVSPPVFDPSQTVTVP